jgi:hypothetical protein
VQTTISVSGGFLLWFKTEEEKEHSLGDLSHPTPISSLFSHFTPDRIFFYLKGNFCVAER